MSALCASHSAVRGWCCGADSDAAALTDALPSQPNLCEVVSLFFSLIRLQQREVEAFSFGCPYLSRLGHLTATLPVLVVCVRPLRFSLDVRRGEHLSYRHVHRAQQQERRFGWTTEKIPSEHYFPPTRFRSLHLAYILDLPFSHQHPKPTSSGRKASQGKSTTNSRSAGLNRATRPTAPRNGYQGRRHQMGMPVMSKGPPRQWLHPYWYVKECIPARLTAPPRRTVRVLHLASAYRVR